MPKTVHRHLRSSAVRRSPQPRRTSGSAGGGGFGSLLARLGLASDRLTTARRRVGR
jgi:hypothetical protein